MNRVVVTALALGVGLSASTNAFATNGYFAHGYGTQTKAMAGAGVALALDSMAPALNPAAVVHVGARIDAGTSMFIPNRGFTASGDPTGACASTQQCSFGLEPRSIKSGKEFFLIPHFGWTHPLSPQASIGIAAYGNGGLITEYRGSSATFGVPAGSVPPGQSATAPGVFGADDTGVDLMQLFITATYARKVNDQLSWGLTPIFASQRFRAKGLGNFATSSADPRNLSNRGYDDAFGFGARIGVMAALTRRLSIGAAWQSRIGMSEFDRYAGLFAGQGDFDVPSNFTVGIAMDLSDTLTAAVDVQHIRYSEVDSIGTSILPSLTVARLGDDNGPGFGWDNVTVIKLGLSARESERRVWRFGYSHTKQPIPNSPFRTAKSCSTCWRLHRSTIT